ncbi:MAG: tyrosine protein phosphatase [Planctomycetes bacterium]|nr:tyrosine protein phosphatase [Planctomycetota bacterium]
MSENLYAIDGPWPSADLATAACPRGGDWLQGDLLAWKQANVEVVVSALTFPEIHDREVVEEPGLCAQLGLQFLAYPINDRESPGSQDSVAKFVKQLGGFLAQGRSVVVHCRAGIGRSSLLAACTLVTAGIDADEAYGRISIARGIRVPDTPEQREWVRRFARWLGNA